METLTRIDQSTCNGQASRAKWNRPKSLREALRREERDSMHFNRVHRKTDIGSRDFHWGNVDRVKEVVLLEAFRHKCFYCGKELTFDTATRDHLVPKTAGGKNKIENLVLCCYVCNQMKWDDVATEDEINRAFEIHKEYRRSQLLKDQHLHRKHLESRGVICPRRELASTASVFHPPK